MIGWHISGLLPSFHFSFLLVCSQPGVHRRVPLFLDPGKGPKSLTNSSSSLRTDNERDTVPLSLFLFLFHTSQVALGLCTHFWFLGEGRCRSLVDWKSRLRLAALLTSKTFLLFPSSKERFVSICLKQSSSWGWGKDCSPTPSSAYLICISAYSLKCKSKNGLDFKKALGSLG